jgi:hypothetical protein
MKTFKLAVPKAKVQFILMPNYGNEGRGRRGANEVEGWEGRGKERKRRWIPWSSQRMTGALGGG